MNRKHPSLRSRQRGVSTLLIAMVLLAILTIVTLFAARFAISEQRTAGNEYRYKIAFQVAEAGLNQALEFVKVNTAAMLSSAAGGWFDPNAPLWMPCSAPKPADMAIDPCLAEPDASVREKMYRYVGGNGANQGRLPLEGVLPAAATIANVGDFEASYQTYATLCRLDLSSGTPRCELDPESNSAFYVTIVSRGTLPGENAAATIKQSFGTFRLLGASPAAPLIAAGTSIGLGNAQIIPNPNAGGHGVPVSIWSKGDAEVDGASFATCQLGEWLANFGTPAPSPTDLLNGVCESCTCNGLCPGYGLLSGNAKSCPIGKDKLEGEDVLDDDGDKSDASPRVLDSKYFPPDLFEYVFGVPSATANAYLTANAKQITDCGTLGPSSSGLHWYTGTDECQVGDVGSLERPVVLVSNAKVGINANSQFFGIVFVRSMAGGAGTEVFSANGNAQIYGSVILEGSAKMGGTPTIVFNRAVLNNVMNSPDFLRYGPIPGSWADSL
ncbi:MAG TPA: PilX N-terminal domain-containing pilus assembly protein [Lysobacter sp.]|nr:PilX N-terminal domain-containing pilus assembly protein [Lysobacter sp.]